MPQDGIKSVVYRSFVTCDDPKGVVDCNTIKISKICSQKMEQKIKTHRTGRNSSLSLASKIEKEEMISKEMMREGFLEGQSSLQLMDICREAKKLNLIVESWSKGLRSIRKSEDLAEDLLEGTLELKDPLIMLSELRESSNQSVRLKTEKCQRSSSRQIVSQSFPVEFQRSQHSSCDSSRYGADEIKKVIKDSLVKRKATPNATVGEKSNSCGMNSDSCSEISSTSISKSSIVNDNVNCRLVSTSPEKNSKRTNLIAKLMGLEEMSSRPMQTTVTKESNCEKMSVYQRRSFDIDMPDARKSNSLINKNVPEKRTLREILESTRFKGLMENDSNKELKPHFHHSLNTSSREWFKDVPPIVLIKPMTLPYNELEGYRAHVSPEEEALNIIAVRRKMKGLRPFDDSDSDRGIWSSDKLLGKQEAEGNSLKQITHKGRAQKHEEEVWESKEGVIGTKKKAAEKLKTSSPIHNISHEKRRIDKKVLTSKKVTANKKPSEKEIIKGKIVSRSHCQEKVTSTGSRKNKNHTLSNSIPDSASKRATRATSNDFNSLRMEKSPPTRKEAKSLTYIVEGDKYDGSTCTNESAEVPLIPTNATLGSLITMQKEMDECDTKIIECCNESSKLKLDAGPVEVIDSNIHSETDIQNCNQGTDLKALLLSSSSFLSLAEELFYLDKNGRTMRQASCCNDNENSRMKPFIDCAIELVERKCRHRDLQVGHSLLEGYMSNSKMQISIEKLVGEVCNDIEALINHRRSICGEKPLVDTMYAVLEGDLWCKQMMSGIWDLGWKNEFSRNEIEEVVNGIEKLILSELVEEFLV